MRMGVIFSVQAAASEAPSSPAFVDGGRVRSWGEVAAEVAGVGEEIRRRGLAADAVPGVALVGETDLDTIVVLLALFELGIAPVVLHPRWTEVERRRLLAELGDPPRIDAAELRAAVRGRAQLPRMPAIDPERALAIVATSGSTGRPKGVVLSRRAFAAAAAASAANLGWRDDDRWLLTLPLAHVGGLSILTRGLAARRPVVLAGPRLPAEDLVEVATRERVTLLSLVPTQLRRLLAAGLAPPPSLRAVLLGGAAAPPDLLAAGADAGWPLLTTYGLTEACSQVATQPYGTVQRGELGCGPPVAGMAVRIAADGGIEVRGPSLMSGYVPADGRPPTVDGWLATGDLGELDAAGNLHVHGRRDDVLVSGGENVHPLEVEAVLEGHPAIAEACVFGVADREWGQRVTAALAAHGERPSDGDLRAWLEARLAAFKRPRRVVWLDTLAHTASGKLDRGATIALALARLDPDPRSDR